MVASIDISLPGKWFSIYKITDAIVWRRKMTVVTISRKEENQISIKSYPPSKRPPWLYTWEYQFTNTKPRQRILMQHRGTACIDLCQTGIIKAFGGYFWNVAASKWRYNRCSYSTLNCFKAQCTELIKLINNYIFSEEELTSKLEVLHFKNKRKAIQSSCPGFLSICNMSNKSM